MNRAPLIPFAVALTLAGASGCAPLVPADATVAASDASAPAGAPPQPAVRPAALAAAPPGPAASVGPAGSARADAAAKPDAVAKPGAGAQRAGTARPGARAAQREGTAGTPAAARRAPASTPAAPGTADGPGPTVTTYVYADAPTPRRREAAADDAPRAAAGRVPEGFNPYRIAFAPGAYRCELGRSVHVRSVSADLRTTVLRWGREEYTLRAVDARSGALRYEDPGSGLAWIVLRDRAMLLDARAGQRLANACRI